MVFKRESYTAELWKEATYNTEVGPRSLSTNRENKPIKLRKIEQNWPADVCPRTNSDCQERNDIKIPWVCSGFQYCLLTWRMLRLGCSSRLGHILLGVNTWPVSAPIVRNRCWVITGAEWLKWAEAVTEVIPETAGSPSTLPVSQESPELPAQPTSHLKFSSSARPSFLEALCHACQPSGFSTQQCNLCCSRWQLLWYPAWPLQQMWHLPPEHSS